MYNNSNTKINSKAFELPDYTPLDASHSAVQFSKHLENIKLNNVNKIGHEKYIMHDEEKVYRFNQQQRSLRNKGDRAVSSAYVEKEHSWATWGGIAEGLAGPAAGIATAIHTEMENKEIRERNAIRQVYAQALKQEYYELARQNEWKRPVVRTANELYRKYKFIEWDQKEIFNKLSISTFGVTLSYDKTGFHITAKCIPLDNSIIIDGTIRAKLYDDNHLYIGQALMILPENGTSDLLSTGNLLSGEIVNPPKSSFYTVEYEPYYLWEIQVREDKKSISVSEIAEDIRKFRKPDFKELSRKHEDELHYANAIRLFDANQMISSSHAFYKAQAEINLISDSPDTQVYFDGFKKHTASFQEETYTSAVKMLESNNYVVVENAIRNFDIIPDWKDSKKLSEEASSKIKELRYQSGLADFKKKRYDSAKAHFASCIDWKDSKEYIEKCERSIVSVKKKRKILILIALVMITVLSYILMSKAKEKGNNQFLQSIKTATPGQAITFGNYKQDSTDPIEWTIIKKTDNSVLLLSNKVLDFVDYCDSGEEENVTWETSDARMWLNTSFYNMAFSSFEKDFILETELFTDGLVTNDKIFLLSGEEYKKLPSNTKEATITAFAATKLTNSRKGMYLGYTLRTPKGVYAVNSDGEIESRIEYHYWDCIRPAMWISTTPAEANE